MDKEEDKYKNILRAEETEITSKENHDEIIEQSAEITKINDFNKKQNNQVKWAVTLMLTLIFIILAIPFIVKEINSFEYIGLEFQKTKLGDLIFYSTKFPVINIQGQVIGTYAINFRSDPRELESIPVIIPNKTIKFMKNHKGYYNDVFITLDPNMKACPDNGIALANMAGFLVDSGLEVKSGVTDEEYAKENNERFVTCKNRAADTVIVVVSGNKTKITKIGDNCYKLTYKNCEIIPVTEKFTLTVLEEYMSKFVKI